MPRLLQDETQDRETKGLCRWLASKLDARRRAREAAEAIYDERISRAALKESP